MRVILNTGLPFTRTVVGSILGARLGGILTDRLSWGLPRYGAGCGCGSGCRVGIKLCFYSCKL